MHPSTKTLDPPWSGHRHHFTMVVIPDRQRFTTFPIRDRQRITTVNENLGQDITILSPDPQIIYPRPSPPDKVLLYWSWFVCFWISILKPFYIYFQHVHIGWYIFSLFWNNWVARLSPRYHQISNFRRPGNRHIFAFSQFCIDSASPWKRFGIASTSPSHHGDAWPGGVQSFRWRVH